jgi:hypothetical protein
MRSAVLAAQRAVPAVPGDAGAPAVADAAAAPVSPAPAAAAATAGTASAEHAPAQPAAASALPDVVAEAKHAWLQAYAEGAPSPRVLRLYEHYRDLVIGHYADLVAKRPAPRTAR